MAPISRPSDGFLGGRLTLRQPAKGHRAGTDALLLAACVPADAEGRAVDVGAGAGAAGLAALARANRLDMTFAEIDGPLVALCGENIAGNGFQDRARAVEADILKAARRRAAGLADGGFDIVLTNPPFLDPARARVSPDASEGARPRRRAGRSGRLDEGRARAAEARRSLPDDPPRRCACRHSGERQGAIGGLRLLPVHAKAEEPAVRLLVAGQKGSRAPLSLAPPLVLHGADGRFTPRAEAIHRGEAAIALA